jgi:NADP-dependent 3-hydroxy acid dehydrogenase YdfG
MNTFDGKVAAITGAGSGIGRALAVHLTGAGCAVALSDVDEAGLAETVALCEGRGVKVTQQRVDVADRDAVFAWAEQVVAEHGKVNLIFNNAGVALSATVSEMAITDFEWLMNVNFWGVVHGTQAFLPHLKATGDGHVVNISSVFGLASIPSQSAYNAAKFAVRGFTDALRIELDVERCGVSATTVHPGGVKTNIAKNMRGDHTAAANFDRIARTTPERAAREILAGVAANRRRVLVGRDANVIDFLARLPGSLLHRLISFGARRRGL